MYLGSDIKTSCEVASRRLFRMDLSDVCPIHNCKIVELPENRGSICLQCAEEDEGGDGGSICIPLAETPPITNRYWFNEGFLIGLILAQEVVTHQGTDGLRRLISNEKSRRTTEDRGL
jgi:hypothetical protein